MNEALGSNSTPPSNNWTFYNSSPGLAAAEEEGEGQGEGEGPALARSNITYVGFYLHQPSTAAIFIASYLLIFLVCMVGNGVVCFIVLRSKNMRTVTNLFILNLAVSDLLVGIFCMPTTLLDNIITGESPDTRDRSGISSATNSAAIIRIKTHKNAATTFVVQLVKLRRYAKDASIGQKTSYAIRKLLEL